MLGQLSYTYTAPSSGGICPREEVQDGATTTGLVTVIEVTSRRIVEIDFFWQRTARDRVCRKVKFLMGTPAIAGT